jgi:hypothetical protein
LTVDSVPKKDTPWTGFVGGLEQLFRSVKARFAFEEDVDPAIRGSVVGRWWLILLDPSTDLTLVAHFTKLRSRVRNVVLGHVHQRDVLVLLDGDVGIKLLAGVQGGCGSYSKHREVRPCIFRWILGPEHFQVRIDALLVQQTCQRAS